MYLDNIKTATERPTMTAKEAARAIYDATTALNAGEITAEECRLHMASLKQGFTEDEWQSVKWRFVAATA